MSKRRRETSRSSRSGGVLPTAVPLSPALVRRGAVVLTLGLAAACRGEDPIPPQVPPEPGASSSTGDIPPQPGPGSGGAGGLGVGGAGGAAGGGGGVGGAGGSAGGSGGSGG